MQIVHKIYTKDGIEIGSCRDILQSKAYEKASLSNQIAVSNPKLWDIEHPYLAEVI